MKKLKFFRRTRTKLYRLGATATVSIFAGFILLSRFLYIPFAGENDMEGNFVGFPFLSSFLYAMGVELSYLSFSIILAYATNYMYEPAKRYFLLLSYAIAFVGFFFVSWVFLAPTKANKIQELLFSIVTSGVAIFVVYKLSNFIKTSRNKNIAKIRMLANVLILKAPNYVKDTDKWSNDVVEPTLDKLNE
ncbi:hypothetical protein ACOKFD_15800 [Flagellimonas sp. S174]|uniref:hypothetical protein n=1 Tax=Flagellimonas sp. S174 TaxID=3410790 RepID=UPI003BF5B5BE